MVITGLELVEAMADLALRVYEEAQAVDAVILLAHEFLRAPDAEGIGHGVILVGQQAEVEVVALLELFQALGAVRADAEHHYTEGRQLAVDVAQAAGLGGAARGHRLGIEIDEHLLAAQIGKAHQVAILIGEGEVGGLGTSF